MVYIIDHRYIILVYLAIFGIRLHVTLRRSHDLNVGSSREPKSQGLASMSQTTPIEILILYFHPKPQDIG